MNSLLATTALIPLAAAGAMALWGRGRELILTRLVALASHAILFSAFALIASWCWAGAVPFEWELGTIYEVHGYHFPIIVFFDAYSAVFLGVTAFLSWLVINYSRYYMHREEGYSRFFGIVFLFVFGMVSLCVAGTLDLLFAAWEVVGLCSFLLIAFYRTRATPVRHALWAFAVYRVCDIGLLLGAWLSHQIWHHTQHFSVMSTLTPDSLAPYVGLPLLLMSIMLLFAAAGKSAQFPFCFWLPKAMEGPTPSSAIFYGALSIHAGVFLLLRTYAVWHSMESTRWAVAGIGLLSAWIGTWSGRVQSNIKAQIAYASIAQVGLMLVELSLGWTTLALIHFVSNACLRAYQLLVSPSVVAHLLRIQASGSDLSISDWSIERRLPQTLRTSLYAFAFNEGYLEIGVRALIWTPMAWLGGLVRRFIAGPTRHFGWILPGVLALAAYQGWVPTETSAAIAMTLALIWSITALSERSSSKASWNYSALSSFTAGLSVFIADPTALGDLDIYYIGVVPSWLLGLAMLRGLHSASFHRFGGKVQEYPGKCALLLLSVLGLSGFPITSAFLGEDLLLHHAIGTHVWLAAGISCVFVINGFTLMRLFAFVCLGPEQSESLPPPERSELPPSHRMSPQSA